MKFRNILKKLAIASQIGSVTASIFLDGHKQEKNLEITNKTLTILSGLDELVNDNR